MAKRRARGPSQGKARTMLHEGRANGSRLSPRQRRFFGWIAGGRKPRSGRGRRRR